MPPYLWAAFTDQDTGPRPRGVIAATISSIHALSVLIVSSSAFPIARLPPVRHLHLHPTAAGPHYAGRRGAWLRGEHRRAATTPRSDSLQSEAGASIWISSTSPRRSAPASALPACRRSISASAASSCLSVMAVGSRLNSASMLLGESSTPRASRCLLTYGQRLQIKIQDQDRGASSPPPFRRSMLCRC